MPDELGTEVRDIVPETGAGTPRGVFSGSFNIGRFHGIDSRTSLPCGHGSLHLSSATPLACVGVVSLSWTIRKRKYFLTSINRTREGVCENVFILLTGSLLILSLLSLIIFNFIR